MLKLEDMPQEFQDAFYIESCHVTGSHDPCHTHKAVCDIQLGDMMRRILELFGIDLVTQKSWNERVVETNKIPRRINPKWHEYYKGHKVHKYKLDQMETWQKEGIR